MKDNRTVFIGIVMMVVISLLVTVYYFNANNCEADGEGLCYSKTEEMYKVELGAYLNVQVESEAQGEYLVETWNQLHPDNLDALVYTVREPLSASVLKEEVPYDIAITSLETAAYFLDDFYDADGLNGVVSSRIPNQMYNMINYQGYYFTPNSVKGPVFIYNKTLLEEHGYSTEDTTGSGLPDTFDSFEKILQASDKILEDVDVVFPFTFKDQTSFYPFLTGNHWHLFMSKDSMDPGFDTREFLEGLKLIELFSDQVIDKESSTPVVEEETEEETPVENTQETQNENTPEEIETEVEVVYENTADSLPWQYETAFYNRQTYFTLLDPELTQFKEHEALTEDEYVVAPLPTYNDNNLMPMASVYGYVINKDVKFPSAAAEVIRILRTGGAMALFDTSRGTYPIYNIQYIDELDVDESTLNYVRAYNYHDTPSVMALKGNPKVLARSIYSEVDIMQPLMDLYNGEITKEEAQKIIVGLSETWYKTKEIEE